MLPKVQVTPKHTYTFDPMKLEWANYAAVWAQCRNLSGNELTHNLSRNIWPQTSQLAEPLWTNPSMKSGICVHKLISTSKKERKKKAQTGNELLNILPKSSQVRKKPPPPNCVNLVHTKHNFDSSCLWIRLIKGLVSFPTIILQQKPSYLPENMHA